MTHAFAIFGNAVVDGVAHVADSLLKEYGLHKGDTNLLDIKSFLGLSAAVPVEAFHSGGAAANTAYTLASLGQKVSFMGLVGEEPAGEHFFKDMVDLGIAMTPPQEGVKTLEILILITPDGARTMVQPRPQPASHDDHWVDEGLLANASFLVLEGYATCAYPGAAKFLCKQLKDQKAALLLPAPQVCTDHAASLAMVLENADVLLMGNEHEYEAFAKAWPKLGDKLVKMPHVVTASGGMAEYVNGKERIQIPAQRIDKPVDSTGAGDAFAAGFLLEYASGGDAEKALKRGHQLARAVIQQIGPRLESPARVWAETLPA